MIKTILNKTKNGFGFVLSIIGLLLFAQMLVTMLGLSFGLAGEYWKFAHEINTQYSFFITWCIASSFSVLPFMVWMWGFAKHNRYVENKTIESWSVVSKEKIDE